MVCFFHWNGRKSYGTSPKALGDKDIYVWDGHNYAIEPINHLGFMEGGVVVRVGLAHYNTSAEMERTLGVIAAHLAA